MRGMQSCGVKQLSCIGFGPELRRLPERPYHRAAQEHEAMAAAVRPDSTDRTRSQSVAYLHPISDVELLARAVVYLRHTPGRQRAALPASHSHTRRINQQPAALCKPSVEEESMER